MAENRLPGAEKYLSKETVRQSWKDTLIERANEEVDLWRLLVDLGCEIPEGSDNWKFYCPYSYEHGDGGVSKAARFYGESNTAFCFDNHGRLTPVSVLAVKWGLSWQRTARKILEDKGVHIWTRGYRERYNDLLIETETITKAPADRSAVVQAFQSAVRDMPGYVERQFDASVRAAMESALTALEETGDSFKELNSWVENSKNKVRKAIGTDDANTPTR